MSNIIENYLEARMFAFSGFEVRRNAWPTCKKLRKWKDSDADFLETQNPDVLVLDNPNVCDCAVGVYIENKEDQNAKDWVFIDNTQTT